MDRLRDRESRERADKNIYGSRASVSFNKEYMGKPIQELDLSDCELCTASYRLLPKNSLNEQLLRSSVILTLLLKYLGLELSKSTHCFRRRLTGLLDGPFEAFPDPKLCDPEGKYEALEKYGKDLTTTAREGKLDPVIGRDDEIRRCIQILSRRTKNNPVLIGEPGVGKTAIAEGFSFLGRFLEIVCCISELRFLEEREVIEVCRESVLYWKIDREDEEGSRRCICVDSQLTIPQLVPSYCGESLGKDIGRPFLSKLELNH